MGNMMLALTVAFALASGWARWQGVSLLTDEEGDYLLYRLQPFASLALLHAAVAGVWLFLSGLIAGYFDNRAARLDLPGRLREHPLLRGWLPRGVRERLALWYDDNYGAIISNLSFGFMLGMTGYLGYLLGLPLDIRHVAFSSAELGYASATLSVSVAGFLLAGLFVLLIGTVNLLISFSLALAIALRSRGVRISQPSKLLKALGAKLRRHPLVFIFPPRAESSAENDQ